MHHTDYNAHEMQGIQRGRDWQQPAPVRARKPGRDVLAAVLIALSAALIALIFITC